MMKIKGIKIIRIVLVVLACTAAAIPVNNGIEYFRGIFILSAGYCYDYYCLIELVQKNILYSTIAKFVFVWSLMLLIISVFGLFGAVSFDPQTLQLIINNWLLPHITVTASDFSLLLCVFPCVACIEIFLGRSDSMDGEKKEADDDA